MFVKAFDRKNKAILDGVYSRLSEFYSKNTTYYEIAAETAKRDIIVPIIPYIQKVIHRKKSCHILEVGAGKSKLPSILRETYGNELIITLHDINEVNKENTIMNGALGVYGRLEDLPEAAKYDIIVSYFVYEHVSDPVAFLDKIDQILQPGGFICTVCPKYDFPFYIPPAIRHRGYLRGCIGSLRLSISNMLTAISGRPAFFVETEPYVFHRPWRRDADAVHLVLPADFKAHLTGRYEFSKLPIQSPGWFAGVLRRAMMMCIVAYKRP